MAPVAVPKTTTAPAPLLHFRLPCPGPSRSFPPAALEAVKRYLAMVLCVYLASVCPAALVVELEVVLEVEPVEV